VFFNARATESGDILPLSAEHIEQDAKHVMASTNLNIIEIWRGIVKPISKSILQGLKLQKVNYALICSNASTAKANTRLIVMSVHFGSTGSTASGIIRRPKSSKKSEPTQFA